MGYVYLSAHSLCCRLRMSTRSPQSNQYSSKTKMQNFKLKVNLGRYETEDAAFSTRDTFFMLRILERALDDHYPTSSFWDNHSENFRIWNCQSKSFTGRTASVDLIQTFFLGFWLSTVKLLSQKLVAEIKLSWKKNASKTLSNIRLHVITFRRKITSFWRNYPKNVQKTSKLQILIFS